MGFFLRETNGNLATWPCLMDKIIYGLWTMFCCWIVTHGPETSSSIFCEKTVPHIWLSRLRLEYLITPLSRLSHFSLDPSTTWAEEVHVFLGWWLPPLKMINPPQNGIVTLRSSQWKIHSKSRFIAGSIINL